MDKNLRTNGIFWNLSKMRGCIITMIVIDCFCVFSNVVSDFVCSKEVIEWIGGRVSV